jgi:hypothetical protein
MRAGLCPIVNQWAAKLRPRLDFPTPPLDVAKVITPNIDRLMNYEIPCAMNS